MSTYSKILRIGGLASLFGAVLLSTTSCSLQQSYIDTDGIYNKERHKEPVTYNNTDYYQQYFKERASDANEYVTDIDNYSSYNNQGYAGWGDNNTDTDVYLFNNSYWGYGGFGFGYGFGMGFGGWYGSWGYPGWYGGWGYPGWGYGGWYGGWGYPYYGNSYRNVSYANSRRVYNDNRYVSSNNSIRNSRGVNNAASRDYRSVTPRRTISTPAVLNDRSFTRDSNTRFNNNTNSRNQNNYRNDSFNNNRSSNTRFNSNSSAPRMNTSPAPRMSTGGGGGRSVGGGGRR